MSDANTFYAHRDTCAQCRDHPFRLCAVGEEILLSQLPDPAHRCAVCGREWVDSDAGFDTCARCARCV